MGENGPVHPSPPDLPDDVHESLASQSPERLETIATYASDLTVWKRHQHKQGREQRCDEDAIDPDDRAALDGRGISTDPADYDDVPTSSAIHHSEDDQTDERDRLSVLLLAMARERHTEE